MNSVVRRYELQVGENHMNLHPKAVVLSAAIKPRAQHVDIWCLIPNEAFTEIVTRTFLVEPTGDLIEHNGTLKFIATCLADSGAFVTVWHVFEVVSAAKSELSA